MGNQLPTINNQSAQFGFNDPNANPDGSKLPQHGFFIFDEIAFDSRFEGGNLMAADKVGPGEYNLWISPDCYKTMYETKQRVSFHFKVINVNLNGLPSRDITFRIMNMDKLEYANYKNGMVPVFSAPSNNFAWQYLPTPLTDLQLINKKTIEIAFKYNFNGQDSQQGVSFAFTFPYTYTDNLKFLDQMERTYALNPQIYFHRELLTYSPEGRRIDMLTITAHDPYSLNPTAPYPLEPLLPGLFPTHPLDLKEAPLLKNRNLHRPYVFKNKGYILLSGRVHAQESPANFMLQGFLQSLLNIQDPVSQSLLQNFVFVIVPMINPDGVARGHYRTDLKGRDMNRFYDKAQSMPKELPGPAAVMDLACSLAQNMRLVMYIDFHAHSNIDSGFVLGAYHPDPEVMTEIRLFARLWDIYSDNFDFNSCEFGAANKEINAGIAKSAVRNATGIVHSYTLEAGYHLTKKDPNRYNQVTNITQDLSRAVNKRMGVMEFMEIGTALRHAMLESLTGFHPFSHLCNTWYGDVTGLRTRIHQNLIRNQEVIERAQIEGGFNNMEESGML